MAVETARYLVHDTLADPAWEYYHAAGMLCGSSALLSAGATSFTEDGIGLQAFAASKLTTALPGYAMPAG